ncbi:hypothetical protein [Methanothrix sp.]|jgi:phosphinothricin acetyltransferase|uniref:hypothetical protein n=1 Tax=Methanothrix sp. TaxID=90426 RepID=UPI003BB6C6A3
MEHLIGIMKPEDWEQVSSIYLEGIITGNSTFEADLPIGTNGVAPTCGSTD